MTTTAYANAPDVSADDYLVVGLATCFIKADGEVHQVKIAEPIPSSTLETIVRGVPTSYELAYGTTIGAVVGESLTLPTEFPAETQFCDEFADRAISAARTYKSTSHAAAQSLIPVGTLRQDFNYSLERKRVLNSERIVKTEDNVKQHSYTHQTL